VNRILPIAVIAAAVTAIIGFAFGAHIFRWEMFIWSASVILLAWALLMRQRADELNRKTIYWQQTVIREQDKLLGQIFIQDIDGRE
jgi:phosphate starvation-inducible membrane PsiE